MRIHQGSLPLDEMDASELEYAATCPLKLYHTAKHLPSPETSPRILTPVNTRMLLVDWDADDFGPISEGGIIDIRFVAGARYLAILTERSIQLWDLRRENDVPIAFMSVEGRGKRHLYVDTDLDGRVVFLVIEELPESK